MQSIIVTQGEKLQSLRQSVPQHLDRIQFRGAGGQEPENVIFLSNIGLQQVAKR